MKGPRETGGLLLSPVILATLQNMPDYDFRKEATIGHSWSEHVASDLLSFGVNCKASPLIIVAFKDRAELENEQDVILGEGPQCVEVKSRNLSFTDDPLSFPYSTAFIDTVSGWEKKTPPPLAVVLVSQITRCKLVIPVSEKQSFWKTRRSYDRIRKHPDTWYEIDKSRLKKFSDFSIWLKERFPTT